VDLTDILGRKDVPKPWAEGEKIPWNDPHFSKRMLQEHLSQDHDLASRRGSIIDGHVNWIHNHVLKQRPSRIIDLGCGPGLYINRLTKLGHRCTGIDFSPASIDYATEQARKDNLRCRYIEQDIRTADFGDRYGLVMLIFGEFNVFRPTEAKNIIEKSYHALAPNGILLIEPHTFKAVHDIGENPPHWYSSQGGLFSDKPHICLRESFWNEDSNVAIERYHIIDAESGAVSFHSASVQAYTNEQYQTLLKDCGFGTLNSLPSLDGGMEFLDDNFLVILARKE
jgi:SAM-dependent methyltransferase